MFRQRTVALMARRILCAQIERNSTAAILPIAVKSTQTLFDAPQSVQFIQTRSYCVVKKKKQKKNPPAVEHVGRLDLRIGKVIGVSVAPDAETLYLTKIDIGGQVLSIVAGLTNFITADELLGKNAVILCNLKPAKLRGHVSEGMILCAKSGDKMELLMPPANASPGDLVFCEGYERVPVENPRDKKKLFDPLADDLRTNDSLIACYKDAALYVPDKGNISAASFKGAKIA